MNHKAGSIAHLGIRVLSILAGILVGGIIGFYTALALVVAKARFGYYIFAIHDLSEIRLETATIFLGVIAGGLLAYRMPRRLLRAVLRGLVGLIIGALLGALLGMLFGNTPEAVWAWAIIVSVLALLGVMAVWLRTMKSRRLTRLDLGAASVVGLTVLFVFLLGFKDPAAPVDVPEIEPVPLPTPSAVDEVVFLVGDAGATEAEHTPLLKALQFDIEHWSALLAREAAVSVVYAGDLVYPVGVRDRDHPAFPQDSSRLWNQIELVGGPAALRYRSQGLFVTGNHDWGNSNSSIGIDRVINLSNQLDLARKAGRAVTLVPEAGKPGPLVQDVRTNIRFVFLDTHWFLRSHSASERTTFLNRLEEALNTAGDRHVIMVAHHPYQSAGPHGAIIPGRHNWSVEYLLKQSGALVQDLNAPVYRDLLAGMKRIFASAARPPLVFVGGHDHSLQVLEKRDKTDPAYMLVSGAGSKISGIRTLPGMHYGAGRPGYMMLVFRKDDAVDLFVVAGNPDLLKCHAQEELIQQACMTNGENAFDIVYGHTLAAAPDKPILTDSLSAATPPGENEAGETVANVNVEAPEEPSPFSRSVAWWTRNIISADAAVAEDKEDVEVPPPAVPARMLYYQPDSVVTTAGASYLAGGMQRFLLGDLNRHLWDVPVRLPVLNLDDLGSDIVVEELTGGMQTVGIRLQGSSGVTYQFRNIVKNATRALNNEVSKATVGQVLQDQLAAQFPLGAMVVAELLNAVDVLVATPRPVVMPNDERLGPSRPYFAGRVGWIEVRPNEGDDDGPGFAGSRKIVGGPEIFEELRQDTTSYADARTYLRARLVDFLVGDWDRHRDNWRWARFEEDGRARWEPIPRDRDWAFTRSDGLISGAAAVVFPRYVGFSEELPPMDRLAASAYPLDHLVLAALPRAAFEAEVRRVQAMLSDSVLAGALAVLPAAYQEVESARLMQTLRVRRGLLPQMADAWFDLLSQTVHVYGYDGLVDTIRLETIGGDRFRVRAWTEGHEAYPYFERTLEVGLTRRVRLYLEPGTDIVEEPDSFPAEVIVVLPGEDDDGQRDY